MKYPYFRGLEADRYSFYRVPKALIKVDLFEKMSGDAKLLYARCVETSVQLLQSNLRRITMDAGIPQ